MKGLEKLGNRSTIALDTSVLINHFRCHNRVDTFYADIRRKYNAVYVPAVAKMEVYYGTKQELIQFWTDIFSTIDVLPFTDSVIHVAYDTVIQLKRKSVLLDIADIMIAATAIAAELPLATLNVSHFDRIENLKIITV